MKGYEYAARARARALQMKLLKRYSVQARRLSAGISAFTENLCERVLIDYRGIQKASSVFLCEIKRGPVAPRLELGRLSRRGGERSAG